MKSDASRAYLLEFTVADQAWWYQPEHSIVNVCRSCDWLILLCEALRKSSFRLHPLHHSPCGHSCLLVTHKVTCTLFGVLHTEAGMRGNAGLAKPCWFYISSASGLDLNTTHLPGDRVGIPPYGS